MKNKLTIAAFVCISIVILLGAYTPKANSNSGGAPVGNASNPLGNGTKTCTNCHGETASNIPAGSGFIITKNGIVVNKYMPDSTYDVSFGLVANVGNKQTGFECATEGAGGFIGTNNTPGAGAKLIGAANYVTHTTPKTGTNPTWTYKWTAPSAGAGVTVFYGSLRVDNTAIYNANVALLEETIQLVNNNHSFTGLCCYPNPSNGLVTIKYEGVPMLVNICNLTGKTISQLWLTKSETIQLNPGIYLVNAVKGNNKFSQKIIIN